MNSSINSSFNFTLHTRIIDLLTHKKCNTITHCQLPASSQKPKRKQQQQQQQQQQQKTHRQSSQRKKLKLNMSITEAQRRGLAIYPKVSGFISVACSSLIILSILSDRRKRTKIHMRLVLGMSLIDISNSITFGLSTWPIPKNSGAVWSIGNDSSCEAQGFFVQFGISAGTLNGLF